MNIDYDELRAKAEAALEHTTGCYFLVSDCPAWRYIAAASPDVMLGLLDEAANAKHTVLCQEAEIAELRQELPRVMERSWTDLRKEIEWLRAALEAQGGGRFTAIEQRALRNAALADATHEQVIGGRE